MDDKVKNFIKLMLPIAQDEDTRSGIKPLITITQSAHESGWGLSGLTQKANNLFGFTGEGWEHEGKPVIKLPTAEYVQRVVKDADGNPVYDNTTGRHVMETVKVVVDRPFRSYESWAESIRDWARLLHAPRYAAALVAAQSGSMDVFAHEISKAGYATDPRYAEGLIRVGGIVATFPGVLP